MRTCTPRSRQARTWVSAAPSVHSVSGRMRSVDSAIAMNSVGAIGALRRVEPAHQRFDAVHHAAAQVHLRLEMQLSCWLAIAERSSPPMASLRTVFSSCAAS